MSPTLAAAGNVKYSPASMKKILASMLLAGVVAAGTANPAHAAAPTTWVEGWAASPHSSAAETEVPTFADRTLRMIVHLHATGTSVRITVSNSFGDRAVRFGRAAVGLRTSGAAVT